MQEEKPMIGGISVVLAATFVTVFITSIFQGRSFTEYWTLGEYPWWASFLFSATTGPTGEEAGWRGMIIYYI